MQIKIKKGRLNAGKGGKMKGTELQNEQKKEQMSSASANGEVMEKPGAGKQFLRALGYGGVYIGGQIGGGIIVSIIAGMKSGYEAAQQGITDAAKIQEMYTETFMGMSGIMVAIAAIITIAFLAIFFLARKEKFADKINLRKISAKTFITSVGIGLAMNFLTLAFIVSLPEEIAKSYQQSSSVLVGGGFIITLIGTVLAAPVVEEIIFRGLILDRLKKGIPVTAAIIISSLLFGLAHGQIVWICYTTVFGVVLAYLYHKTGSIGATITAHLTYNLTSTVLGYSGINFGIAFYYVTAAVSLILLIVILVLFKRYEKNKEMAEVEVKTVAA